jgi:hypothetical protein
MSARICVVVLLLLGLSQQSVVVGRSQQGDGALYRWDGQQWVPVDGSGVRLSVGPDGAPWVVIRGMKSIVS